MRQAIEEETRHQSWQPTHQRDGVHSLFPLQRKTHIPPGSHPGLPPTCLGLVESQFGASGCPPWPCWPLRGEEEGQNLQLSHPWPSAVAPRFPLSSKNEMKLERSRGGKEIRIATPLIPSWMGMATLSRTIILNDDDVGEKFSWFLRSSCSWIESTWLSSSLSLFHFWLKNKYNKSGNY